MDKGTIIRTAVLAYALINQVLVLNGVSALPFAEGEVEQALSVAFTVGASIVAWYKNNFIGKKGEKQRKALEQKGLK